ncbi:MAG: DUF1553 domain-containing protein [Rubripirellula sp.]|nr:DUF1553 domain-containing protein [Rubripirellula sp.]
MAYFPAVGSLPAEEAQANKPNLDSESVEFFEAKIRPVLVEHCMECHGSEAKNLKGGLRLDSKAAARRGGDSGPAVVAGNTEESLLLAALKYEDFEMPPQGKLPDSVIADFVKWIEMGAPDPREPNLHNAEEIAGAEIDFEAAREFWSFQPVQRPEIPVVKQVDWPSAEIDFFTLAKMEELGLVPVSTTSKRTLIRRATFDLIGLPPTPKQVEAFLTDDSPNAFEAVVDRLLESKHYGERWGRYWLDVARYAEDQAHTFAVRANSSGYRYRDWVIDAFNRDLPYDQFVRLQIAGDLIGPGSAGNPEFTENYDHLIALGFFGLGAQYYKNSDKAKAVADELDDRVDTLSRGFLGLTVSCARCHDHKFDPIPTQDYYSLAGIFSSSKLHNASLCTAEDISAYNEGQKQIKQAEEEIKKFLANVKTSAAESKVDQIASYMRAVWKIRAARRRGESVKEAEFAEAEGLNPFFLKRWDAFLDSQQQDKIPALAEWFALDQAEQASDEAKKVPDKPEHSNVVTVPEKVDRIAAAFQARVQRDIRIRDGITDEQFDNAIVKHTAGSPRFVTPLVTKSRPTANIKANIRGAKQLILVVSDGGNGRSCDHADWIAPRIIGEQGELKLTELKWAKHEGDSGIRVNTNFHGKPIRVGGKEYPEGIGVHATSTITFDLPAGYERFEAIGGLDNSGSDQGGCGDQASVQFSVYTETPTSEPLLRFVLGKDGPFAVPDKELERFLEGQQRNDLLKLRAEVESTKRDAPPMYAIAHSYTESRPADMKVFVRGNPARQREVAPRRFLRVLAGENRENYSSGSGRRELADAIADPDNPLTARVMVNRVWQHHFGRGIVATPSNFGKLGEAPTHPELLDYLAARFIESGWSIKTLHREIMLSTTYRLSSDWNQENADIDADNRYLWQVNRRRLDIESWRDTLLNVAGTLDRTFGGPSTNLSDQNNVRRTVYAKISRHQLDDLLRLFDFPDANITSSKRTETTVPQQQLFVLNSPFMIKQAKAFAARLHQEAPDNDGDRIELAFQLAYGRAASDAESRLGLGYLQGTHDPDNQLTRWESYAQVLLGSNELMYVD